MANLLSKKPIDIMTFKSKDKIFGVTSREKMH